MSYYLFLDDCRMPSDVTWIVLPSFPWTLAQNYGEFINFISSKGLPAWISFDHDLAPEHYPVGPQIENAVIDYTKFKHKTGYHCAEWLCQYCLHYNYKLPQWSVHSHNKAGTKNIIRLLTQTQERLKKQHECL